MAVPECNSFIINLVVVTTIISATFLGLFLSTSHEFKTIIFVLIYQYLVFIIIETAIGLAEIWVEPTQALYDQFSPFSLQYSSRKMQYCAH